MNDTKFWIGLPDGWTRTAFDPEYQQRVHVTLSDTALALPELAAKCDALRNLLAETDGHTTEDVLFSAEYFASPEPGHLIHCVLAICNLAASEFRNIEPDWFDVRAANEHDTPARDHEQLRPVASRRTSFETGPAELGVDATATAQYFVEIPGRGDALLISFSSTTIGYWAELLELFDTIVSTVEFTDAS